MSIRKIVVATAVIAALSPVISNASSERTSIRACASAFATQMASPGANTPTFKLDYSETNDLVSNFYMTSYTFVLQAQDPKTGAVVARANCSTNTHGAVTAIVALPLDGKTATLASRF